VVPLSVVHLLVDRFRLGSPRAHVQQQIQMSIQHLNGKEVHFERLGVDRRHVLWRLLGFSMAEEEQSVRLGGPEVKGDRAGLLGVPLVEDDVRLGGLKGDGVEGCHVLAFKSYGAVDFHLRIALFGQTGQLQPHVVVFVHNL
ncbi:hypothetical protein NQD34_011293, partial [Periophthalmus magnuspinnatus]|uniref:Uncharacterized protein n=1 Tax=Periophthalmus magnuspinnatus TaxID=409849 RepID=A0A3B4B7C2_9GOBI